LAVTIDLDVLLLFVWAAFCIGLHTPRPMINGLDENFGPPASTPIVRNESASDVHGRKLLRKMSRKLSQRMSLAATTDSMNSGTLDGAVDDDGEIELRSPLPVFPAGAALGSHLNCWSQPVCSDFYVRGPNYLKDKVKIESADFLWPLRGIDLFLTDTCPENAGRFVFIIIFLLNLTVRKYQNFN